MLLEINKDTLFQVSGLQVRIPKFQIFVKIFCTNFYIHSPVWSCNVGVPPLYTNMTAGK